VPEVHVNIEQLEAFGRTMARSGESVQEIARGLARAMGNLDHRDAEVARLQTQVQQTVRDLERLATRLKSEHVPMSQRMVNTLKQFRAR